ncbi:NRDE family protein [Antarcticibacterium arcticum]|uniref:NRDE family protein n=1 Tax=Antarcticibacterium arcticum TaxID=2585771 RepID=A0A5B8YI03_9FLAO|nr:NRDE family protein [Antarcticibacterium arcticum]QED36233.1 NRDE family protein [Antarcticibacterium arcticum]
MCTVTLTPLPDYKYGFVLTSSRDEAPGREALPPDFYLEAGVKLLYPMDKESGGSWIGISENSRVICLLNGGREAHERNVSYRLSRGVVVKDLLKAAIIDETIHTYNLINIEPFTIITADWNHGLRFLEIMWDGSEKHIRELDLTNHLWSSSPLYDTGMKKQRNEWFKNFMREKELTPENLWDFHHSAGIGDKNIDVIMDRGFVRTQSITQIINNSAETEMIFKDLQKEKITEKTFSTI